MKSSQPSACTPFYHSNIRRKVMKKNLFDKENSKKNAPFWYKYPFDALIRHCTPSGAKADSKECSGV